MPLKVKLSDGTEKTVALAELPAIAGNIKSLEDRQLDVIDDTGERRKIPSSSLKEAVNLGYQVVSDDDLRQEGLEEKYGGIGGQLLSGALGAGSAATYGILPQVLTKTGLVDQQTLKDVADANQSAFLAGEIGGNLVPGILSGGSTLVAKGASKALPGIVTKLAIEAGEEVAKRAGKGIAGRAAKLATEGVIESTAASIGDLITEDALGNAELNAESLLAAAGTGAAIGGTTGGLFGAATKAAARATQGVRAKAAESFRKALDEGDAGIVKWAGGTRKDFTKLAQSNSLNEKQLTDYILDTAGLADSKDAIKAQRSVSKSDQGLLKTIFTDVSQLEANNQTVKEAAGELMQESLEAIDQDFAARLADGTITREQQVYGGDIARYLEDKFVKQLDGVVDPRTGAVKKLAENLREASYVRDASGAIIGSKPLSPAQIKLQSRIFGEMGFDRQSETKIAEAARFLRGKLEGDIDRLIQATDPTGELISKYKAGKELYQKAITTEQLLEKKLVSEISNNRGFSLTEAVLTGAGASVAGLPGAIAGYGLRRAQRKYGDIAYSALLAKIGRKQEAMMRAVSDAADGFVRNSARAVRADLSLDQEYSDKEMKKAEKEIEQFRTNPEEYVNSFVENNRELYQAAPKVADALQSKVTAAKEFLASKFPSNQSDAFNYRPEVSKSAALAYIDYRKAINDPQAALAMIGKGYANQRYAEAIKAVYPQLWTEFTGMMMERAKRAKSIRERERIGNFIKVKMSPSNSPQGLAMLQSGFSGAKPESAPAKTGGKVPVSAAQNLGASERAQTGLDKTLYRA